MVDGRREELLNQVGEECNKASILAQKLMMVQQEPVNICKEFGNVELMSGYELMVKKTSQLEESVNNFKSISQSFNELDVTKLWTIWNNPQIPIFTQAWNLSNQIHLFYL